MMRIWLHSGGAVVPIFSDRHQEERFSDTLGLLATGINTSEIARLRRLGDLALPAADRLEMRHMLDIRTESAFHTFRTRQRSVLAAIAADVTVDEPSARTLFREEMRAAADEGRSKNRRSRIAAAMSPKLIGWGVGGFVGASFDWRAAAAVLGATAAGKLGDYLASSSAQAIADEPARGEHALHHHYATLAHPDT